MKKTLFAGIIMTGALLVGCSEDEGSTQVESMKEEYDTLQKNYEQLATQLEELQKEYDEAVAQKEDENVEEVNEVKSETPKEMITSLDQLKQQAPSTVNGPYKTLVFSENGEGTYEVSALTLAQAPTSNANIYELALKELFPELTFNEVIENDDQTITIDFNENSTGSPNMTATAQVETFLDRLSFFLYYNFPQLKAYNLYSNGEPTLLGDFGPFDTPIENKSFEFNSKNFTLTN